MQTPPEKVTPIMADASCFCLNLQQYERPESFCASGDCKNSRQPCLRRRGEKQEGERAI